MWWWVLAGLAGAQESPRYTLSVSMAGGQTADLVLWPDQEPADAVEAMVFDHLAGDAGRDVARPPREQRHPDTPVIQAPLSAPKRPWVALRIHINVWILGPVVA